jgi:hypothetical protein
MSGQTDSEQRIMFVALYDGPRRRLILRGASAQIHSLFDVKHLPAMSA